MVSFSFLLVSYGVASLCNSVWCDILISIAADPIKLKGGTLLIENGVFRIQ